MITSTQTAPEASSAVARGPISVRDLELSAPLPDLREMINDEQTSGRAWLIVRLFGEPLGIQRVDLAADTADVTWLAEILRSSWRVAAEGRGSSLDGATPGPLVTQPTSFFADHQRYLQIAGPASVVVCTRERPDDLARCLQSLVEQDHPQFTVWVIDSAPRTDATRDVADQFAGRLNIRYVHEPRPGLSRARNRALEQDLDEIVAWIDDDELADPQWLSELTRALESDGDASGVSGLVVPAELETSAQIWFEQFGGHSKGRGFAADDFSPETRSRQSPLYPLPAFGVGANMAFRTASLRSLGGFDPALGAGTRTKGGEDTRMFTEILRRNGRTLYRPTALTRHFHRRDLAGLSAQMRGYGSGLTAFYTALVIDDPRVIIELLRLTGRAARDLLSSSSLRTATLEPDFPPELLKGNRRGMLVGPLAYLHERVQNMAFERRKTR